jgi:hypothetical protein
MFSYSWHARIRTGQGDRSKSFPPHRLSPFQKVNFFILRHRLIGKRVGVRGNGRVEIKNSSEKDRRLGGLCAEAQEFETLDRWPG